MQIVLNEGQISDLFFNYDNLTYGALFATKRDKNDDGPSEDEIIDAVKKDAEDFATCYPSDEPKADMVNWLVQDFLKRR